jgi:hypothetical protein
MPALKYRDPSDGQFKYYTGPSGPPGVEGPEGPLGPKGEPGEGIAAGGVIYQYLTKNSAADYDTAWTTPLPTFIDHTDLITQWPSAPTGSSAVSSSDGMLYTKRETYWGPAKGTLLYSGMEMLSDPSSSAIGYRDIQTFLSGFTYPYPYRVDVVCGLVGGFSGGNSSFLFDIQDLQRGAVYSAGFAVFCNAGYWAAYPSQCCFANTAGQSAAFKVRQNVTANGGGVVHCGGFVSYKLFAD